MEKKNIDWSSIGFAYMPTDYRYVSNFKDGKWDEGTLSTDPISYSTSVLVCFSILRVYSRV